MPSGRLVMELVRERRLPFDAAGVRGRRHPHRCPPILRAARRRAGGLPGADRAHQDRRGDLPHRPRAPDAAGDPRFPQPHHVQHVVVGSGGDVGRKALQQPRPREPVPSGGHGRLLREKRDRLRRPIARGAAESSRGGGIPREQDLHRVLREQLHGQHREQGRRVPLRGREGLVSQGALGAAVAGPRALLRAALQGEAHLGAPRHRRGVREVRHGRRGGCRRRLPADELAGAALRARAAGGERCEVRHGADLREQGPAL
mmetsp:Transcript_91764/g.256435  ORF Transcript_91764/g.256435 Transcript_91764/m.256435 type:complete len:259 (-) Transcript_91764:1384-2160(-)